eukprot:3375935-Rhodomonas_salina.10
MGGKSFHTRPMPCPVLTARMVLPGFEYVVDPDKFPCQGAISRNGIGGVLTYGGTRSALSAAY